MGERRKVWPVILLFLLAIGFLTVLGFLLQGGLGEHEIIGRDKVAVVRVEGVLMDGTRTVKQLASLEEKKDIKAVVLRVDSPGGGVGASQEIFEQVKRLKKFKKVVVSMGGVAASGGYYISCPADKIVADPGTVTGSIGVIMQFLNVEKLAQKLYLKEVTIKSGKNKDLGNPFREMTAEQRAILQGVSDDIHRQFVEAVATERKLPLKEVEKIADGRIFSGRQARRLKLVDELGNVEQAIDLAAKLAGIGGKPKVLWVKERESFWRQLLFDDPEEALLGLFARFWGRMGLRADYLLSGWTQ